MRSFVPDGAWRAGAFRLRVAAALEDVAGNSVARVFDADRRAGDPSVDESAAAGAMRDVPFAVRRAADDRPVGAVVGVDGARR